MTVVLSVQSLISVTFLSSSLLHMLHMCLELGVSQEHSTMTVSQEEPLPSENLR